MYVSVCITISVYVCHPLCVLSAVRVLYMVLDLKNCAISGYKCVYMFEHMVVYN